MKRFRRRLLIFSILTAAVIALIILALRFSAYRATNGFCCSFYYVCYDGADDKASASAVSVAVVNYGGAGYVIKDGGKYFVAVACYYTEKDAEKVCAELGLRGITCKVICAERNGFSLSGRARANAEKYAGNLNTLTQLSAVLYELANSLDNYSVTQGEARAVLKDVGNALSSLKKQNPSNCFTEELERLVKELEEVSEGYVLSHKVRRMQIALTDAVVNVNIF